MKKLIPMAVIAVFGALSIVSCKKSSSTGNYTCSCTYKLFGTDTTQSYTYAGVTKDSATKGCHDVQTVIQMLDSAGTCGLK